MSIFDNRFVCVECANCGIAFGISATFEDRRREDHKTFHCPAGHANFFSSQTEAEKLKLERDRLAQRIAQRDDKIKQMEKEAISAKGQMTKLRKRIGNGSCPCCNRSFQDLQRHMKTKHPDFKTADVVPLRASK